MESQVKSYVDIPGLWFSTIDGFRNIRYGVCLMMRGRFALDVMDDAPSREIGYHLDANRRACP